LPVAIGEALGSTLGRAAYRIGWRRAVVEEQLARSFPDRDPHWIRATARACYEHVGREAVALAGFFQGDAHAIREAVVEFEGLGALRSALAEGRGLVIVTGHFGNWEVAGGAVAAHGLPIEAVMQSLTNPHLNRYVQRVRRRLGMGLIDRVEAWDRLRSGLRAGRIIAFVADQDARERGVFVPFFGRSASTHRAPALLAIRARAPFFFGGATRLAPRRYRVWAVRLEPASEGELRDRVVDLTRRWTEGLEARIRLSPEQYFWHHRRWKTRPQGTAPVGAGIRDAGSDG
jgi:KDO2-lipid IV(A) lauroyltransferase